MLQLAMVKTREITVHPSQDSTRTQVKIVSTPPASGSSLAAWEDWVVTNGSGDTTVVVMAELIDDNKKSHIVYEFENLNDALMFKLFAS